MSQDTVDSRAEAPPFKPAGAIVLWLVLLVLLAITVGSAYVDLGPWNPVMNLGVAVVKAALIMWFFMHLRETGSNTRIMAIGAFFWLAVLITITLTDYQTRPDHSVYTEVSATDDVAGRREARAREQDGRDSGKAVVPLLREQRVERL